MKVWASAPQAAAEGYVRRTAHIESTAGIDDIWFMTPEDTRPLADDWLLAVGLVVGMTLGEDVHVAGRVSERRIGAIEEIQRVTMLRHPGLHHVRVTVDDGSLFFMAGQFVTHGLATRNIRPADLLVERIQVVQ